MKKRTPPRRISARFPLRVVNVSGAPGLPLLQACAAVGIVLRRVPRAARRSSPRALAEAGRLLRSLTAARLVLITGPSGGGKSTLLQQLLRCSRRRGDRPVLLQDTPPRPSIPIIQRLHGSTARRLALLARAGLADATLLARSARELSEGQRYRFHLALAMDRARRRGSRTLFADEFGSTLDRATARALCFTLSRWIRASVRPRTIILATAHDDVAAWLRPDVLVRCELGGSWSVIPAPAGDRGDAVPPAPLRPLVSSLPLHHPASASHVHASRPRRLSLAVRPVR